MIVIEGIKRAMEVFIEKPGGDHGHRVSITMRTTKDAQGTTEKEFNDSNNQDSRFFQDLR